MQTRISDRARSGNRDDYHTIFVRCVHQLIEFGYQRMQPVDKFELWKEEEISGELARHVDAVLDERPKPWMRFYSLAPERHVDEPHITMSIRRLGKRRKRLDFRFTCRQRLPVQRFIFEAKSLQQSTATNLLDEDGLGRILSGQYARDDVAAGLLGYVQISNSAAFALLLRSELTVNAARYAVTSGGQWERSNFTGGPANTFRTVHCRERLSDVTIFTTLLLFRSSNGAHCR